jgi:uncharacterized protein
MLLAATLFAAPALAVPTVDRPVNDYAGVLGPADVQRISDRIVAVRAATGVQMALLVVDTTSGEPIDDFSLAAARQWRGGSADRSDGVLVTFAVRDHKSDVDVGPGVQERIPDVIARRILDEARPALRESRYGDAFYGVVVALGGRVSGAGAPVVPVANATAPKDDNGLTLFVLVAVLGFGVIGGVWLYRSGEEKRRREAAAEDERRAYARNMERDDRIREESMAREMREREAAAAVERYRVTAPQHAPVTATESTKPRTYPPHAPKSPARSIYTPPPARPERSSYEAPARRSSPRIDTPVPAYRAPSPAFGVSIVTETPSYSVCRSQSPAFGSTPWSSDTSSSISSSDTSPWSSDTSSSISSSDNSGGGGSFDGGGASSGW